MPSSNNYSPPNGAERILNLRGRQAFLPYRMIFDMIYSVRGVFDTIEAACAAQKRKKRGRCAYGWFPACKKHLETRGGYVHHQL